MKQELLKNNWIQKTVRIRPEYINLCAYFEFVAVRENTDRHTFFNEVFTYSMDYILKNGFNYYIDEYKPRRKPKGFLMKKTTNESFMKSFDFYKEVFQEKYSRKLYVCEYVELILFIYAVTKLNSDELSSIDIEWGIKQL